MRRTTISASLTRLFLVGLLALAPALHVAIAQAVQSPALMPLAEVKPGMHGIGRTIFEGNRIEDFQVEILGIMQNAGPQQSIILARLSGGPLAQAGVIQGMSGSPVFIGGKLIGAVALGFPFSKEPIAGIQPIEQMIHDGDSRLRAASNLDPQPTPFGALAQIGTPLSLNGFTARTLQTFAPRFRELGFEPQQGVSAGSPPSPAISGSVQPGSMISVQLMSGDLSVSADGTVTYVNGKDLWAFGHRFLDIGSTEIPFARSEVIAVIPTLNSSFKVSAAKEWVGTISSDRSTAVAGEIGKRANMVPVNIEMHSGTTGPHMYHFQVVRDRLLTPYLTQMALFSAIDATERTVGIGTMRLNLRVDFEGDTPPMILRDTFVSDGGLAQQVAGDAVVSLGFVLSNGFKNLEVKQISYQIDPVEAKHQLHITQAWTSTHEVRPGESVTVNALLGGEDGIELLRTATYQVPIGAPEGPLNFTVSDANTMNFPEFAGMNPASARTPAQLIEMLNRYRGSQAAYVRVWRSQPAFTLAGPSPGGELTDPPPSVMLVLADPSTSPIANTAQLATRGSGVAELVIPVDGYVVTGSKTIQVDVKE